MEIWFGTAAATAMIALYVTDPPRQQGGQARPLPLRPALGALLVATVRSAFRAGPEVVCDTSERRSNVRAFRRSDVGRGWEPGTSEPPNLQRDDAFTKFGDVV